MNDMEMEVITAMVANDVPIERLPIVVIDSDDEKKGDQKSLYPCRELVLPQPVHSKLEKKKHAKKAGTNQIQTNKLVGPSTEDEYMG
ncbi:hypothetical protein LOK49_LG06G01731 [Camellia lanceoleosa]|uniref:Uncharacterized protein n=1 Tax=Camellia lanceoleosa TaxID=1840588 RepID=A0ACC0HF64_9ERIC|nr:hypothetical protein LOK49_LG06G01731 [Camellia lanceoleosa]